MSEVTEEFDIFDEEEIEHVDAELMDEEDEKAVGEFVPDTAPIFAVIDEELAKYSSDELKSKILDAKNGVEQNYWELCKCLYYVQKKMEYKVWNFKTFNEYVEKDLTFQKSKARYLIKIWEQLYINQHDKSVFNKVMSVGWSKAKEMIFVVTPENVDEWVEKARHISVEALKKEIKAKIDKAIPDDHKDALANESEVENTPMAQASKTMSLTFDYNDYLAFTEALDRVKSENSTDSGMSTSSALALICGDYLASNPVEGTENSGRKFMIQSISKYENLAGVEVIIVDKKDEQVLYGANTLVDLLKKSIA